ncbi:hypothetical protein [Nocardiopsis lucentensis]|uniref:hypothetical protein n=1 Tax=Nocardiopsis lucentensis TaxID=53441 RepID=UPI001268D3D3|nr:hypothetical protein [Nocardiopsis lucentensis]
MDRWPHEELVTMYGGPMDGEQMAYDPGDLPADPREWGGYYMVPPEMAPEAPVGVELRAAYEPDPDGDVTRWLFRGWVPW